MGSFTAIDGIKRARVYVVGRVCFRNVGAPVSKVIEREIDGRPYSGRILRTSSERRRRKQNKKKKNGEKKHPDPPTDLNVLSFEWTSDLIAPMIDHYFN